jgi:hypothetical protein
VGEAENGDAGEEERHDQVEGLPGGAWRCFGLFGGDQDLTLRQ